MMEFYEVDIFTMKREEFGSLNKGVYERRVHGRQKCEADSLEIPHEGLFLKVYTSTESCWYCGCFISERG